MITCNRCGKQVHVGSRNCIYCGAPLSSGTSGGSGAKKGTPEPSELPAWLESLRATNGPGTPPSNQPHFSASDIIDEGALPSWMRPENADMSDGFSGQFPALRRASMPAPNTDHEALPSNGIAAASLIDQQSLPSWLQESPTTDPQPVQRGFSAASLIQPDTLPDWMRNAQLPSAPSSPPPPTTTPPVEPMTPMHGMPMNSLPDPSVGASLTNALSPWLSGQTHPQNPAQQSPTTAPGNPQTGLSASSLLDMNALPNWLREGDQPYQGQPQPASDRRGDPSWQGNSGNFPPVPSTGQAPNAGGSLSAGSLIDRNALPEWLRAASEQPQMGQRSDPSWQGNPGNFPPAPSAQDSSGIRPAAYGTPRVENLRVPSRPRAEMEPPAQNEVAANVFSSMLGVASSAPYFPPQGHVVAGLAPAMGTPAMGTPAIGGQQQTFQGSQPQQMYSSPTGSPPQSPPTNMQPGIANPAQAPGYMPAGYQGGYSTANQPGQSNPPVGTQGNVGAGFAPALAQDGQKGNAQPANSTRSGHTTKRGIIETILSWFSRQS